MAELKLKQKRPALLGLLKEVFNWYPAEYPAEERKLLFKLDLSILTFACLCFFKLLDQTNISNAYVSGLEEDFELDGNELNYFNVYYFTAYVVFQVPGLLLMSRPNLYVLTKQQRRARWLLPTLEVFWGIVTFAQCRVTSVNQIYACRSIIGMLEAPCSWYSGPELFKRAGTWFKWLFIIDGVITVPYALIGFRIFPGVPDSPKPVFLPGADISIAKDRLKRAGIVRPGKLTLNVFKRTLSRWHIYEFVFCYICMIIWEIPKPLKFVAWYLFGLAGCASPILYSTVNTIVKGDSEERALILGTMMTVGYSFNVWVPLLLFPTAGSDGAPRWRKGWPVTYVFYFLLWSGFIASLSIHRRREKERLAAISETETDSNESESITVVEELVAGKK
ncbi:MFS general substrate transporter [Podospora didyma]|uniref:MFS general substrate transporter n=1 Tax=Podospora didyma TaxID=330526 RepID=A0AAE0N914_9PEZI|nr:MFS general substrate transporter [Podospora didyma]